MKYKVLALDLDGTLVGNDKEIKERDRQLVIEAQQRGVVVVLASGRPMFGMTPIAEAIRMDEFGGFILSFNGGKTIQFPTEEVIQEKVFPLDMLAAIYAVAKEEKMEMISYEDDYILTERPEDIYVYKESFLNRMPMRKVDKLTEYITFNVPKCLMVGDADRLALVEQRMKQDFGHRLNIFRSEPYFLEIMPQGIDKGQALGKVLQHIGCSREEMIAIGDGFNDLTMVQSAGLGIAMANAQQVIKDAAQYVTLTNEENGVAHVVEKFILGK
jgi:Cof subfamily protein (haloacid dehalogenase superfamily)